MTVKDRVLRLLLEEESLSGGKTAEALGVSRTAVWKAVEELRREGAAIDACRGGGYRLRDRDGLLNADAVRSFLGPGGGPEIIYAGDRIDSTNAEALRRLRSGTAAPFALLAGEQTRGRGRKGRPFHSPPGGLYMTVALPLTLQLSDLTALTAFAALCVSHALEEKAALRPRIKWINDLYLDGKKIAGILTEADVDAESGDAGFVRVGIGINTGFGEAPGGLEDKMAFLGIPALRPALAAAIAADLARYDPAIPLDVPAYLERSMTVGRRVRVLSGGREHEGTAVGIEKNGALILDEGGRKETLISGDLTQVT